MRSRIGRNGGGGLAALLLLVLAAGCTPTVDVESNLNPAYSADLEKVFVVVDTRRIDEATEKIWDGGNEFGGGAAKADTTCFMKEFLPKLAEYFGEVGVEVKGHAVTGLELSPDVITRKITDYKPDAVLNIKESWFMVNRDPGFLGIGASETITAIDLDCSLTSDDFPDEVVWRALVKVKGQAGAWQAMADELAISVVDQLTVDGLIDPDSQSTPQPEPGAGEA